MPADTATRLRRLKPITIELLIIALLLGVTCYWLLFIRATNSGLTFENKLLIPEQLFGTVVDGRRQFHLTVAEGSREFLSGKQTPTAGVNGPFLGPTLRLRRGEDVDLIVQNNLDEITTMHWHGMHVPARMDGTPHQKIEPGVSWTASFPVDQQAAPLWYHPHPHGNTGRQVYRGVAGLMWIDVVTFITGVQCGHCYEHARLFDKVLRENDINLVIITPESEPDQERVAVLSSSLISDTAGKWAGWFGMAHTGPTHGTVLLDATGEVVWRSTAPEPYMDVQNLVNRAKNLPGT